MKKNFLCLVILVLFGGFVFFTGWTQIKLKKGNYGIVVTKLGGINSTPVKKGGVTFHKGFLIPSNARIIEFSNEPFFCEKTIKGELPSAEAYSGNSLYDFSYSFTFQMELHADPEMVVELMKKNKITDQESLTKYLDVTAQEICQNSAAFFLKESKNNRDFMAENYGIVEIFKGTGLYEKFPEISIDALALKESKFPDYELYEKSRNMILNEVTK